MKQYVIIVHQPDATPELPYNLEIHNKMDDGKMYNSLNGKFFATLDEAKKYADAIGMEILEIREAMGWDYRTIWSK